MRRDAFLGSSLSAVALLAYPSGVRAATPAARLEVNEFSQDASMMAALRRAVSAMQQVADPRDPRCWHYWHYSHMMPRGVPMPSGMEHVFNQCLHHVEYFYPWHRGLLYFFERMLQTMSGNSKLMLPYWDYYRHPDIPDVFAAPTITNGSANPLYFENRSGTSAPDLGLEAFDPSVAIFPQSAGGRAAFESVAQYDPHDAVHGLVGGAMGRVPTSAADPIFWVHHCNIDRLWSGWVAAGNGRLMPPSSDRWWNQAWSYNLDGTWNMSTRQMAETTALGYTFSDVSLPAQAATLPTPGPLLQTETVTGASMADPNVLGGTGGFSLGVNSATIAVPVWHAAQPRFHELLDLQLPEVKNIGIVLESVQLTALGAEGGYAYKVYLNLPERAQANVPANAYYLGNLNSFTISAQTRGGSAVITLPATAAFRAQEALGSLDFSKATISFIRVGAPRVAPPTNSVFITVGRVRVLAVP